MCCVKYYSVRAKENFESDEEASQEGSTTYRRHLEAVDLTTPFAR